MGFYTWEQICKPGEGWSDTAPCPRLCTATSVSISFNIYDVACTNPHWSKKNTATSVSISFNIYDLACSNSHWSKKNTANQFQSVSTYTPALLVQILQKGGFISWRVGEFKSSKKGSFCYLESGNLLAILPWDASWHSLALGSEHQGVLHQSFEAFFLHKFLGEQRLHSSKANIQDHQH